MKVFVAKSNDLKKRWDPLYHSPVFRDNLARIRKSHWCTIGACSIFSEETWDKSKLFSEYFPYIEISSINVTDGIISETKIIPTIQAPSRAQMVARAGDILVSMTRPTRNAIARLNGDTDLAIASTGFAIIREIDREAILPDFLFHVLRLDFCTLQFEQRCSGGNYPAITKADLHDVIIPCPSRDAQARIVAELNAAYAEKRKADEKSEKLLDSIDGIVLNELGISPLPSPDTSLSARIFTVSVRDVVNKTLAPAHYLGKLDFSASRFDCHPFCDVVAIDPPESMPNVLPPYHLVPMDAVSAEYGSIERIEEISIGNMGGYSMFRNGDVIFAKISPCMENGKSAVVSTGLPGILFGSTEFLVFRPKDKRILPEFLHLLLRMDALRDNAARNLTGTTGHQRITKEYFRHLEIPVPPKLVQEAIVAKVANIREEAKRLKADALESLSAAKKRIESEIIGEPGE